MKRMLTIGMAALLLGLGGAGAAQTTSMRSTHVAPNGSVHTTARTVGPGGVSTTRTVDRPDGTREVRRTVRRSEVTYGHGRRMMRERVCRVRWHHHHKVRTCTSHHRWRHHDRDHDNG